MFNPDTKLGLVIPTLGEAANLRPLLDRVRTALDSTGIPYEILVVDDDSGDGTEGMVQAIAAQDARIRLLVRKGERGLTGAIMHGWRHTDAGFLGVMDADLQHPPELLPQLLAEVRNGSDIALASRYARGGSLGGWHPIRRLISALAVWVTWPLQPRHRRAADPMSGFFIVRRECVPLSVLQPRGFKLLLEVLARGSVQSLSEVPFAFGRRRAGSSKARLKVAWEYLVLLTRLYAERWTRAGLAPAPGD